MIRKHILKTATIAMLMAFGANTAHSADLMTSKRYLETSWAVSTINGVAPPTDLTIIISFEDDYILIDQGCYSFMAWPQESGDMKLQMIEPFVACQMPISDEQNAVYYIFEHAEAFTLTGPDSFRLTTGGRDSLEADELLPQILRLETPQD